MSDEEPLVTLAYLLDNPPREIIVNTEEGPMKIKIRDPTTQDRINAILEARKDPRWKDMTPEDRNGLILDLIAIKMIVEPKISLEDYYKANSLRLGNILNEVIMDYAKRLRKLTANRAKEIQDFLEQMRVNNP